MNEDTVPWSERGEYDFFDLVSSPPGQTPVEASPDRDPELGIRKAFTRKNDFGLLEFDVTGGPVLCFTLIGTSGRQAWEPFVIGADDFVNGVVSWKGK